MVVAGNYTANPSISSLTLRELAQSQLKYNESQNIKQDIRINLDRKNQSEQICTDPELMNLLIATSL